MESYLTFQVEKIKGKIAFGAVKQTLREPRRDHFFSQTGEVEFGGGYQATGHFCDGAFEQAKEEWSFQCYPIGKYKEHKIEIPKDVKLKPGQYIRVKYEGKLKYNTELSFHKDRVGSKKSIKKFKTYDEDRKGIIFWS